MWSGDIEVNTYTKPRLECKKYIDGLLGSIGVHLFFMQTCLPRYFTICFNFLSVYSYKNAKNY